MKLYKKLLFISCFLISQVAFGEATVFKMIEELRDDVEKIVHRYDSKALVFFHITPNIQNTKLLGTPYALNQITINDSLGMPNVEEFSVTVVSSDEELQAKVEPLLTEFFKPYGGKLKLVVQTENSKERGIASAPPPEKSMNPLWYLVIGMGLILIGVFAYFKLRKTSGPEALKQTIMESADKIATALESSRQESYQAEEISREVQNIEGDDIGDRAILDLHVDSAKALLYDCYWSQSDKYANYLWRRVSGKVKEEVVSSEKKLSEYLKYVSSLGETNIGSHLNPYYLDPLSINHISNEDLSVFVKKHLGFLNQLPDLRAQELDLKASERVKASQESENIDASSLRTKLESSKASKPRTLPTTVRLTIRSVDDEVELMELERLTFEMKKGVPSVIWSDEVGDEDLEKILEDFTAVELAEMWVGPESVLKRLQDSMPEKKFGLVSSYLEKVSPSRKSASMRRFHSMVLDYISEHNTPESHDEVA